MYLIFNQEIKQQSMSKLNFGSPYPVWGLAFGASVL